MDKSQAIYYVKTCLKLTNTNPRMKKDIILRKKQKHYISLFLLPYELVLLFDFNIFLKLCFKHKGNYFSVTLWMLNVLYMGKDLFLSSWRYNIAFICINIYDKT